MVPSPVRPSPGYTGSPTSSISGAISKNYPNRENQHIKETGKRSDAGTGSSSGSPISSSGSTTSSGVRKITSSESDANKIRMDSPNTGKVTASSASLQSPSFFQTKAQAHYANGSNGHQAASKESNQRILPSTPVGISQQQFSEMEYLTSRYLRQQQQQQQQQHLQQQQQQHQQIQSLFQQQQQQQQFPQEPRRSVVRSGCFDTQLNVLRQEMVTF